MKLTDIIKNKKFYEMEADNEQDIDNNGEEDLKILQFITQINSSLEIVSDGKHQKIFFRKHPSCFFLSRVIQKEFMRQCQVENNIGKMTELLQAYKYLSVEMNCNYEILKDFKFLYYLSTDSVYNTVSILSYLLGFFINILCVIHIRYEDEEVKYDSEKADIVIQNLSYFLCGLDILA